MAVLYAPIWLIQKSFYFAVLALIIGLVVLLLYEREA
jgi:hypothetical protein